MGEQHGKGACDRLFGWCNAWLQSYIQTKPIHGLKDLVDAFTKGGQAMMQKDPSGPAFVVQVFDPGMYRPSKRLFFNCPALKITRTYSL